MSSQRQIEANRRNAQRSTGPRSAHGKARVASNALTHGLTGNQIVLPNERAEDFDAFQLGLLSDMSPGGELERALAEKIVAGLWRLRRIPVLETALYRRGVKFEEEEISGETDPSIIAARSLERYSLTFANLSRHETALSASLLRTLHELQRLQAKRAGEPIAAPDVLDVDVNIRQDGQTNPEPISKSELLSADPAPAKVEPDLNSSEEGKPQISFFITNSQKAQLRERGLSKDDIAKMNPAEAHRVLGIT
jgi:hypothetical protein